MKKCLMTLAVVVLALATVAVVACGDSTTTTTAGATQTTMGEAGTTLMPPATTVAGPALPETKAGEYVDLTPEQAKQLIDSDPAVVVLDVSPLYAEGHLPGAINHYGGDGSLAAAIPTLDAEATYLVYCHSESASRAGAQALVDAGFANVYRLQGEYDAWVAAGYPIEM